MSTIGCCALIGTRGIWSELIWVLEIFFLDDMRNASQNELNLKSNPASATMLKQTNSSCNRDRVQRSMYSKGLRHLFDSHCKRHSERSCLPALTFSIIAPIANDPRTRTTVPLYSLSRMDRLILLGSGHCGLDFSSFEFPAMSGVHVDVVSLTWGRVVFMVRAFPGFVMLLHSLVSGLQGGQVFGERCCIVKLQLLSVLSHGLNWRSSSCHTCLDLVQISSLWGGKPV